MIFISASGSSSIFILKERPNDGRTTTTTSGLLTRRFYSGMVTRLCRSERRNSMGSMFDDVKNSFLPIVPPFVHVSAVPPPSVCPRECSPPSVCPRECSPLSKNAKNGFVAFDRARFVFALVAELVLVYNRSFIESVAPLIIEGKFCPRSGR